ncbi:DUF6207 family protein [Streptomyces sp. NPDC049590]|uniref:nucleotidyltransferase family protein n=1 Tax=Streptomyces sp. NPDC049590 TaxID=3154834 RepID=UPI003416B83D
MDVGQSMEPIRDDHITEPGLVVVDGASADDATASAFPDGEGAGIGAVRQAVILAGGVGSRMQPLTLTRPKPMVEVHGTPILRHQLDWFAGSGVERVVISAGHRAQVINDYLLACPSPVHTEVVVEPRPLGRGGGMKLAAAALEWPDEP